MISVQPKYLFKKLMQAQTMKAAILTFHRAHNYGAVLQAYALQEALSHLDLSVRIIDYVPKHLAKRYNVYSPERFLSRSIAKTVGKLKFQFRTFSFHVRRYNHFNKFILKRLKLTEPCPDRLPDDFDFYLFGSDQIWNPEITRGFDNNYFGLFPAKNSARRISYAASMENINLSHLDTSFLETALDSLDAISVRESDLAERLKLLTTKPIFTVLDPVLLHDSTFWSDIAQPPSSLPKYVLLYQVRSNPETRRLAESIAKKIGARVIEVTNSINTDTPISFDVKLDASVEEFLGYINNAAHIVTSSFHGTAFAILFNKPFHSVILPDGKNERVISLLRTLDLSKHLVELGETPELSAPDFSRPNSLLLAEREKSLEFIRKAVSTSL